MLNWMRRKWLYLSAAIVAAGCAGLLLGYIIGRFGLIYHAGTWLAELTSSHAELTTLPSANSEIVTAYHVINVTRIPVGRVFHMVQVNNHIVFTTRFGQIGVLTGGRAISLPIQVPLGFEELRADRVLETPAFDIDEVKVTDLLTIERAPGVFDLYASGVLYENDCFHLQINKIGLRADDSGVSPVGETWQTVFRTRDCVALQPDGTLAKGAQVGGRMVRMGPNAIALSIGALGNEIRVPNLNPNSDFGTVVVVPLDGGAPSTFVRGLRNPLGLLVTRSGQIWSTEHGPQGGDELNLLVRGRDYGWPYVTYGMEYGGRPTPWPHSPRVGSHDGYEPPRFSWLPSIGVSHLAQPDTREFPYWENRLVVTSLRDNAIHLVRVEDNDRIAIDERIPFNGDRLRDIINLADGRMAISTDAGDILLLANADRDHQADWRPASIDIAGLDPLIDEASLNQSPDRLAASVFYERCGGCHSLSGEINAGPALGDVVGRTVGSYPGYAYSPALSGHDERWTKERLRRYILSPQAVYPGAAMPEPYIDFDVDQLVDYLARQPSAPSAAARAPTAQ